MLLQDFKNKIDEFLIYIEVERNLSTHTYRAYQSDLEQFAAFWRTIQTREKKVCTLQEILERFFIALYNKKLDKNSIARKISCFQSFAKFLKKQGIVLVINLRRPRLDKKLPTYLSVDEIFYLLDNLALQQMPTQKPYRDKAIFELLYATGIRCSELVKITLEHISLEHKTIRILGKGKKERIVLFGQKAKETLEHYLQQERMPVQTLQEPLFLNCRNQPLTTRSIQRIIAMFHTFLHIKRGLTPHKIRHSFATHLLHQGTDLRIVQELLGHKTLASTEKYVHVANQQLSELCDTLHPMNTWLKPKKNNS